MKQKGLIALTFLMGLLGILGGPVINAIEPPATIKSIAVPLFLCIAIISAVFAVVTNQQFNSTKKVWYWAAVVIIVGPLIVFVGWFWYTAKPATNYFIVDATDNMYPFLDDVHAAIADMSLSSAHNKHGLGLRIYGGKIFSSDTGSTPSCDANTKLLVPPNFYENANIEVDKGLDAVQATNSGSLLAAVNQTFNKDLISYNKPVTLIIIASAKYSECTPPPSRYYLDDTVNEIHATGNRINLRILVISVGDLDIQNSDLLHKYANNFGACYVNIPTPATLTKTIEANSSYCSNYLVSRATLTLV